MKPVPQLLKECHCKNGLANCANICTVVGMPITGWKQVCNMTVTKVSIKRLQVKRDRADIPRLLQVSFQNPVYSDATELLHGTNFIKGVVILCLEVQGVPHTR